MCQETMKIREQDDLESESIQNVLKQPLIVKKVLESLDFYSLLQCRVVNKSWLKEATAVASKKCKISFDSIESVQDFMTISSTSSTEIIFAHVKFNFEVDSIANKSEALYAFLENHAKHLNSIESPTGSVCGTDSVQDWTNNALNLIKTMKPDETLEEIVGDENANYMHTTTDETDESSLQEIIINDEVEESKVKHSTAPRKLKSVHFSMVENPEYVPIPYSNEGYDSFADFYPYYLGEHSNETGRRLHVLGITNSIILIIIGTFTLTPILYLVAIIQAYAFALGAHFYFDKHIPRPTIRNPVYMIMGTFKLWWEVASGQRAL